MKFTSISGGKKIGVVVFLGRSTTPKLGRITNSLQIENRKPLQKKTAVQLPCRESTT